MRIRVLMNVAILLKDRELWICKQICFETETWANWFDALCQGLIRTEMEPWLKEQLFMLRKQCILKAKLESPPP